VTAGGAGGASFGVGRGWGFCTDVIVL
jgi:hypothetical protein